MATMLTDLAAAFGTVSPRPNIPTAGDTMAGSRFDLVSSILKLATTDSNTPEQRAALQVQDDQKKAALLVEDAKKQQAISEEERIKAYYAEPGPKY